jgi:hypothetical protein
MAPGQPFPRGRTAQAIAGRAAFPIPAVLGHKWLVLLEGRRHGASWRSRLLHDADKVRPGYLWRWIVRDEVEYCDRLHRTRAPHHWEWWWGPVGGDDSSACAPMSDGARRELMTDWCARQRARGGTPAEYAPRVLDVYEERRDQLRFHPETRVWVESRLAELAPPRAR